MHLRINGKNLYLSEEFESYYVEMARKELNISDDEMYGSIIHNSDSVKRKRKIWRKVYKILQNESLMDQATLFNKLLYFDYVGEEARELTVANNILWSYSCAFGHCHVMSIKFENEKYVHDYAADNWPYKFPGGNNVAIVHSSVPSIFRKLLYKMDNRAYLTIFNTEDIEKIKGQLDDFYIQFSNGRKITFKKQEIYDDN